MAFSRRKIFDFNSLDELSRKKTWVHALDARVKIITALIFLVVVLSLGKYEVANLLPFFLFPLISLKLAGLPLGKLLRRSLIVLPFVGLVGIFNPVFDTEPLVYIGSFSLSAGWISFFSIILRGYLAAFTSLVLLSTTGFFPLCTALCEMRVPTILSTQLILLYRSIYVLTDEATRMMDAWKLRSFGKKLDFRTWGSLMGHLMLRSVDRSERMHQGLMARCFTGKIQYASVSRIKFSDMCYMSICILFFLFLRFYSPSLHLGRSLESLFS